MSIYRRKHEGKRSRFFTAEFTYRGKVYRQSGFVDRDSAKHWIETESKRLRRSAVGYTKPMLKSVIVPLIDEYAAHLVKQGRDEEYAYIAERRLKRLAGECGWLTIGDINSVGISDWLNQRHEFHGKAIGNRTKNQHAEIAATFCKWLVKPKRLLAHNPLDEIDYLPEQTNENYRRAGTVEELNNLLATCPANRRMFYLFLIYCPLRMDTIRKLSWRMFHLDSQPPYIEIPAPLNKSRRAEKSLLRYDVAQELRTAKKQAKAKADDLAFMPFPTIDEWREDLTTAGIVFEQGKDQQRFDRHAMRRTLVRMCELSGAKEGMASLILHHRDIRTTRKYYGISKTDELVADALERLPAVGKVRKAQ